MFFFAGTSTLAFFLNPEAPSIFMHIGFNVTVPDFCITSEEEGGAPLEDGGGHCSSRSAPTLLTDPNVPLSPASPAAAQHTHTQNWLPGSKAQHLFGCHMTFRVFLLSSLALRHFLPSLSLSTRGSSSRKKQKAQQLQPPLVGYFPPLKA